MTTLDKINSTFTFLTTEFGFKLIESRQQDNYMGKYLLIYRNDNSKLQLEISADDQFLHCEIRRLINGQPANYWDKDNCIGFESLAILESDYNYDSHDYFVGGPKGLTGVLKNTANLFQRFKLFFTTSLWINTKKIQQLRDADFENKFGFIPNKNIPTYFEQVKSKAIQYLSDKGFQLIFDSDELAPFDNNSLIKSIVFSNQKDTIKFSALDWRDSYYIYYIEINNKKEFEIDLRINDIEKAVSQTMDKLKLLIEKNNH